MIHSVLSAARGTTHQRVARTAWRAQCVAQISTWNPRAQPLLRQLARNVDKYVLNWSTLTLRVLQLQTQCARNAAIVILERT